VKLCRGLVAYARQILHSSQPIRAAPIDLAHRIAKFPEP
jgi:hypothetical protein